LGESASTEIFAAAVDFGYAAVNPVSLAIRHKMCRPQRLNWCKPINVHPKRSDFVILASFFGQATLQMVLGDAGVRGRCLNTIGKLNLEAVPYGR
jgi:hypothetical protein